MVEDIEEGGTSKENEDLDEEEDEEAQRSHGRTVDGVRESEEELDEEDDFEEADEFDEELHIADREEVDKEDEDEDEEDSLDDSDQDNSEDETSDDGSPSQSSEEEELDEDARSEAAVAAANAAAERKALRKAERWAAAVGATPPPKKANGASYLARRAVVGVSPGPPASPSSPSKRVAWNLKRNTRHTPSGPPNPVKGEGLKALLSSTPRKSLLRPIHAAPHMAPHLSLIHI